MVIKIEGGTVVYPEKEVQADVWIDNDTIAAIGVANLQADKVIDARGCYVMPGAIDAHVHMQLPTPAGPSSDDFYTGSKAAICGGTTTLIDFVTPQKGQSLVDAVADRKREAAKSLIDYSFHVSPVEWRDTTEQEIIECINQGLRSFKIYMAYKGAVGLDDEDIKKVLQVVGRNGGMVTVHAELGDEIDDLRLKAGQNGDLSPAAHEATRPPHTESDAVKRIVDMAHEAKCPLYVVHVSTKESLKYIVNAQQSGQSVFAETCPHYLVLDKRVYQGSFEQTVKYVLSPPLREEADQDALWNGLANGTVRVVGTDHCPFSFQQKSVGKDDFRLIPNGAGGVEHRAGLLFTYGVLTGRISRSQWVDVSSTQPAKIFGLYPKKGTIAKGADADIVVWDPNAESRISAQNHHQNTDINIYEGFTVRGAVKHLFKHGEPIIENQILQPDIPGGTFLERK
jgi:dihydropyrimidinase